MTNLKLPSKMFEKVYPSKVEMISILLISILSEFTSSALIAVW